MGSEMCIRDRVEWEFFEMALIFSVGYWTSFGPVSVLSLGLELALPLVTILPLKAVWIGDCLG